MTEQEKFKDLTMKWSFNSSPDSDAWLYEEAKKLFTAGLHTKTELEEYYKIGVQDGIDEAQRS